MFFPLILCGRTDGTYNPTQHLGDVFHANYKDACSPLCPSLAAGGLGQSCQELGHHTAPLSFEAVAADIESTANAGSRVATELETSWYVDGIFPSVEVWGFLF